MPTFRAAAERRSTDTEAHIKVTREDNIMSTPNNHTAKWPELTFLVFVYALYILAVTAPLGFIISAYKVYRFKRLTEQRAETPTHEALLIATHYEWLVRTFIFMGVLTMAAVGLAYYIVGYIIAGIALVWWFYRLIRGATALVTHRTMPATICTQSLCYGQAESV
jgi:uncharacterized membrane protein